jgi:hypothetical protein
MLSFDQRMTGALFSPSQDGGAQPIEAIEVETGIQSGTSRALLVGWFLCPGWGSCSLGLWAENYSILSPQAKVNLGVSVRCVGYIALR